MRRHNGQPMFGTVPAKQDKANNARGPAFNDVLIKLQKGWTIYCPHAIKRPPFLRDEYGDSQQKIRRCVLTRLRENGLVQQSSRDTDGTVYVAR